MNTQYQVQLTLEGNKEQIDFSLRAICRDIYGVGKDNNTPLTDIRARGYEDILIHSELKEI